MRRAPAPFMTAGLLLLAALPTLAAGKPAINGNDGLPDSFILEAGVSCDFNLQINTLVDGAHFIDFPIADNGTQRSLVGGHVVLQATNLDTGASLAYNASGPGTYLISGDQESIVAGGPSLFWTFPGDAGGPGLWYTRGQTAIVVDRNTDTYTTFDTPHNTIDVCAALGGGSASE